MNWFLEWAGKHCTMLGLNSEDDLKTVIAWESLLLAAGGDSQSLAAATAWLGVNPSAFAEHRYAGKMLSHLAALQRALREVRAIERQHVIETYANKFGDCAICDSTAWLKVPRLESVKDGEWFPVRAVVGAPAYQSYVVLCSCALGRWKRDNWKSDKVPMTLEQYEKFNPRWRVQMERRREEQRQALQFAEPRPPDFAKTIDRLLLKLAEKWPNYNKGQVLENRP